MGLLYLHQAYKSLRGGIVPENTRTVQLIKNSPFSQDQNIQGDQKVSVHMMITIPKATSNVQSFPRQYPDIY